MSTLPGSFVTLLFAYPRRDLKDQPIYSDTWKPIAKVMSTLPGTPCCVQMSQALNNAGLTVPGQSWRRNPNPSLPIYNTTWYYLPATDELEDFLSQYGPPEQVNIDGNGNTMAAKDVKSALAGRTGILIFRWNGFHVPPPTDQFEHTELWDGNDIVQRDMNENYLFSVPRVLFWAVDP